MEKAKNKKKKAKRWLKFRHRVVKKLLRICFGWFCEARYRVKIKPLGEKKERQYLILYNHQTAFDQFFVGVSFKKPIYYVASEDLFSNGFVSSLIKYLVEPIPIKKQSTDVRSILNCLKVVKEGGTIAIAPEGNRTYSGKTEYIKPSIASFVRAMKIPVAFYRIEGGYGVHPRWSDKVRRGKMTSYVKSILEPEEVAAMSDEELLARINEEMYVNEGVVDGEYVTKNQAEYLERAIYVCPRCGLSEFESRGNEIKCKKCGLEATYTKTKEFESKDKDFKFRFVTDWYAYQSDFINSFDPLEYTDTPIYEDTVNLSEVILFKKKNPIEENVRVSLYGNRIEIVGKEIEKIVLNFNDISSVAVLGRNKANIYVGEKAYQFKGSKRFCALKYVNIYYRYQNVIAEEKGCTFLGI